MSILLSPSRGVQDRIKYFSRFEHAECHVHQLTHHGAEDQFGRLAGSTEALAEALSPGRSVHYLAAIKEELDGQAPAAAA